LPSKSAKIRALAGAGFSRSEIAKFLGIRYQHVRNVLVASPPETLPKRVTVTIGPAGRVAIPAFYRQLLGLEEGEEVVLSLDGNSLRLESHASRLRRVQQRVASVMKGPEFSVDAFLADRRAQAEREDADG
jgi:AbrB family looped-hinge helix DNA binding protein